MPQTRIDTRRGWIAHRRQELLEAAQDALASGFRIPADDRAIVLCEHDPDCFLVPPDAGERFLVATVTLIAGRSVEAKRRFYASFAQAMARFGIAERDVRIILVEAPAEDWGGLRPPGERNRPRLPDRRLSPGRGRSQRRVG